MLRSLTVILTQGGMAPSHIQLGALVFVVLYRRGNNSVVVNKLPCGSLATITNMITFDEAYTSNVILQLYTSVFSKKIEIIL